MNQLTFDSIVEKQQEECRSLLAGKGKEYIPDPDKDVLGNFKESGAEVGISPMAVLMIFLNKHLRSIKTYVRTGKAGVEPIHGRITDAINYLTLLRGLVEDEDVESLDLDKIPRANILSKPNCPCVLWSTEKCTFTTECGAGDVLLNGTWDGWQAIAVRDCRLCSGTGRIVFTKTGSKMCATRHHPAVKCAECGWTLGIGS